MTGKLLFSNRHFFSVKKCIYTIEEVILLKDATFEDTVFANFYTYKSNPDEDRFGSNRVILV